MKLMHLGDLHIGKTLEDFDLIDDQRYMLDQVVELAKKEGIDAILIAGDVYDKSDPREAAVKLLGYFFSKLIENKIKTYVISGNHDSDVRLNYAQDVYASCGIYITSVFDGAMPKYTLKKDEEEVDIYALPFVKASQVKHYFEDAKIENYNDAVKTVIKNTQIDKARKNVILAHQFVVGEKDPELGDSEGISAKSVARNVGAVDRIKYDCFEDFDYVALGHIHSPQSVGRDNIRYSGSLLKYSVSEAKKEKSIPIITFNGDEKSPQIEFACIKPKRDLREISGSMKELLDKENVKDSDDFIYAKITDETMVSNVMGIFQQVYPNTVRVEFVNRNKGVFDEKSDFEPIEEMDFDELIKDFYKKMTGEDISEAELELLNEAAAKEGIKYETN